MNKSQANFGAFFARGLEAEFISDPVTSLEQAALQLMINISHFLVMIIAVMVVILFRVSHTQAHTMISSLSQRNKY